MSNTEELKNYLINKDDGYLLDDNNNGKTIMLSGAWGTGKTHFWQNEIESKLSEKLKGDKNKACVYVSLYGKDNIESLKNEILFKAYESIKDENKLAKRAISAFGFGSRLLSVSVGGVRANTSAVGDVVEGFFEGKKIDEAESFIADGGIICLDDFERKSKHIDLNDLFGFISQLAIDMNCKIVIILNSDVFEGEEATIFRTVKEKTVNKFFYFEPTVKELFDSIYNHNIKYNKLDDYKEDILHAIEETEELNARIYIQILDNCLEWSVKRYQTKFFRILVLSTSSFSLASLALSYPDKIVVRKPMGSSTYTEISFKELSNYHKIIREKFSQPLDDIPCKTKEYSEIVEAIRSRLRAKTQQGTFIFTDIERDLIEKNINNNQIYLQSLWKYGYQLYYFEDIKQEEYEILVKFVETGILLSKGNM